MYSNILENLKKVNIVKENNKINPNYNIILRKNEEILNDILKMTKFLDEYYQNVPLFQRLYTIVNNIDCVVKCKNENCNNVVKFNRKYNDFCSNKCIGTAKVINDKKKRTSLSNYGVENPSQSENIKKKKEQTTLNNYGVKNPFQSDLIKKKIKDKIKEKHKVEYYVQSSEFKEKFKQTMIDRYGVVHPSYSEIIKEKKKANNIKKYGVEHIKQNKEKLKFLNNKKWLEEQHIVLKKPIYVVGMELGVSPETIYKYYKKHDIDICKHSISTQEKDIKLWLSDLNIDVITNTRKVIPPYELDIYIPEYNLAIEYNGLYWHSELNRSKDYHLVKTKLCEQKGIRLIHIFEDEWRDQQQKCKETLLHILGKSEKGVYARNTTIREITWKEAKEFLNRYHLLGAGAPGNYRIGAFDKDDSLIGVMVFGHKNNEGKDKSIELKRFVTNKKNNPGLGSKMFKYAVKQKKYKEVIAFVDRRWFTGLVKDHIGFKKIGETSPALWWTDFNKRYHRRFVRKEILVKEFFNGEKNISKRKMLNDLGYYRIWDCGKIKLKWNLNENDQIN